MRSFFYNLDKVMSDCDISHNYKLKVFCNRVKDFVMEGTFTKYKKVKTILGYWGEPDSYVSEMTGMKEVTVRQARRNLSNELYELLGYDFFEVISIGDEKALREGDYRLYLAMMSFSADNFVYRELLSSVRSEGRILDDIDISSCKGEIQFLVRHSKQTVNKELSMLDKDKLVYLIRMLDNEIGSPVNVRNLIKCFDRGI